MRRFFGLVLHLSAPALAHARFSARMPASLARLLAALRFAGGSIPETIPVQFQKPYRFNSRNCTGSIPETIPVQFQKPYRFNSRNCTGSIPETVPVQFQKLYRFDSIGLSKTETSLSRHPAAVDGQGDACNVGSRFGGEESAELSNLSGLYKALTGLFLAQ